MVHGETDLGELRLLLEELCCDLCRFEHVIKDQLAPETIRIDREYWLGAPARSPIFASRPSVSSRISWR